MRFSGWSSRATWACSAAVAALAFSGIASAHLSIDPPSVLRGQLVELVFSIPNEDDPVPVDHVTLGIPADFELDDAEAKPGWDQNRTGQAVTWSGGLIPKGEYATFAIRGTAPDKAETVLFNVLRRPILLRRRDVVERLLRDLLERAGCVHGSEGARPRVGRRLLDDRPHGDRPVARFSHYSQAIC